MEVEFSRVSRVICADFQAIRLQRITDPDTGYFIGDNWYWDHGFRFETKR